MKVIVIYDWIGNVIDYIPYLVSSIDYSYSKTVIDYDWWVSLPHVWWEVIIYAVQGPVGLGLTFVALVLMVHDAFDVWTQCCKF